MTTRLRPSVVALALWPAAAWADLPQLSCLDRVDVDARTCILQGMAAEPGAVAGSVCARGLCRVELACELEGPGARTCKGAGHEVYLDWNEEGGAGFNLFVFLPDGSGSRFALCGDCAAPEPIEGPLRQAEVFAFPGGALLEYEVAVETYRVPPDVPAGYFNVREGPGTEYELLFSIPAGVGGIRLTGACRAPEGSPDSREWCPIASSEGAGWMSTLGLEKE